MNPESFGRQILFFFSLYGDVTRSSLVLYREYCIQGGQPRSQVLSLTRLYDACFVANIPLGVLGTGINPNTCRIRWKGKLDLNTDRRGRGNFWIRKEDVSVSKLSEYVWTGPEQIITSLFEWIQLVNCDCPFVRKSGTSAKCWSFLSFSLKWFITKGSHHLQTDGKLYSGS